jgi:hypothetical protein
MRQLEVVVPALKNMFALFMSSGSDSMGKNQSPHKFTLEMGRSKGLFAAGFWKSSDVPS